MMIIGVDFHPEFQQMASVDTDTGECQEKRFEVFTMWVVGDSDIRLRMDGISIAN